MTSRNAFIGGALPLSSKSWGASAPLAPPSAATVIVNATVQASVQSLLVHKLNISRWLQSQGLGAELSKVLLLLMDKS